MANETIYRVRNLLLFRFIFSLVMQILICSRCLNAHLIGGVTYVIDSFIKPCNSFLM